MKKIIFLFVVLITAIVIAGFVTASLGRFGIFIALTILFPGVILIFIFSLIRKSREDKRKLLVSGEPANAKIMSVSDTGVSINNNPRIALQLEVTPQNGLPFTVKIYSVVSRLVPMPYHPGMTVRVRYNPNDLKAVAIESFDEDASGQNNIKMKLLVCPACGGQLKVNDSSFKEKVITCNYCGTVIDLHK